MALKVGVFEGKVVAICPDKAQLSKITGKEYSKEVSYLTPKGCKIVAVLQDVSSKLIAFATFELEKEELRYNNGKFAYKNGVGFTLAFEKDKVSPGFYRNGDVSICMKGEPELLGFLRYWLRIDEDGALEYKVKKFFAEDFSELQKLVNSSLAQTVGAALVVKVNLKNEPSNLVYNKKFIAGKDVEHFKVVYSSDYVKGLIKKKEAKEKIPDYQELIYSMMNPKFPCPHFCHLGPLKVYIEEENKIHNTNQTGLK